MSTTEDRLDVLEADVAEYGDVLKDLMVAQERVDAAVDRIEAAVGSASGDSTESSTPAGSGEEGEWEPDWWTATATDEDWTALCDWVDAWIVRYELASVIRPCWPAHRGVAEELAAMWSAWREAVAKSTDVDTDALTFWHDRVMAPVVGRLRSNQFYPMYSCKDGHKRPNDPVVTDRRTISVEVSSDE